MTDLTTAIGINRPSLYAAFGSKEALFERVLARYGEGPGSPAVAALEAPTARSAVEKLLRFYTDAVHDPKRPRGCLLVQGALACSPESDALKELLAKQRLALETALRDRLKRAKAEGDLPSHVSPTDLARYVMSVCFGLCVLATAGASRDEQRRVASLAMLAFPSAG